MTSYILFMHSMVGTWTISQSLVVNYEVSTIYRLFVLNVFPLGNITVEFFS